MQSLKSLCSVYFSQLSVFISQYQMDVKIRQDDEYFKLTDEQIYELPLETKIWLAKQVIRLYRVRDEERINLIKKWYQLNEGVTLDGN